MPRDPILNTKIMMPILRQTTIARSRLVSQLQHSPGRKLTIISAPAGYGKTTLLQQWATQTESTVAWFTLDQDDQDLTRFLTYLIASIQQADKQLGEVSKELLRSPEALPFKTILIPLINDLMQMDHSVTIVLDDFHVVQQTVILAAVEFFVERLPAHIQVVIATRHPPDLPVARLRVREELTELSLNDLRFRQDEIENFIQQSVNQPIPAGTLHLLQKRTDGWAVALQLAALSLKASPNVDGVLRLLEGAPSHLFDYLAEEVLQHLPDDVIQFIFQTVLLHELCSDLCDYLRDAKNSQHFLDQLNDYYLLITPLDTGRHWFRYHPLFTEFVLQRAQSEYIEQLPSLYHRAAQWFEQQGVIRDAVRYALMAEAYEYVADLIEQNRYLIWVRSELSLLNSWMKQLPQALIHSRPGLCVIYSWALLFSVELQPIEFLLNHAEAGVTTLPPDVQTSMMGEIAAIRASVARIRKDIPNTIQFASHALQLLPLEDNLNRSLLALMLGYAYRLDGNTIEAQKAYQKSISTSYEHGIPFVAALASYSAAHLKMESGQLKEAEKIYQEALQATFIPGMPQLPISAINAVGMANVYYEWNDLDAASSHLERGMQLAANGEQSDVLLAGFTLLARINAAKQDFAGASTALNRALELAQGSTLPWLIPEAQAYQLTLHVFQDHQQSIEQSPLLASDMQGLSDVEQLAAARALIYLGDHERAFLYLDAVEVTATGKYGVLLKHALLRALAMPSQNTQSVSLRWLSVALKYGKDSEYVRAFLDEGTALRDLLRQALAQKIYPDYCFRLLEAFNEQYGFTPNRDIDAMEALTEREIDVLRLIAVGLSNKEIAAQLVIEISTVKTHITHVFQKLNARNRTHAIARAKALLLLP